MDKETFINEVEKEFSEDKIAEMIDEKVSDYINDDWEDEYENEWEAYIEQAGTEAEDDVKQEIIDFVLEKNDLRQEDLDFDVYETIREISDILDCE